MGYTVDDLERIMKIVYLKAIVTKRNEHHIWRASIDEKISWNANIYYEVRRILPNLSKMEFLLLSKEYDNKYFNYYINIAYWDDVIIREHNIKVDQEGGDVD